MRPVTGLPTHVASPAAILFKLRPIVFDGSVLRDSMQGFDKFAKAVYQVAS